MVSCTAPPTSSLDTLDSQTWKEVIFWQQPRGYWSNWTHNYQGYTVRSVGLMYHKSLSINQSSRILCSLIACLDCMKDLTD